MVIAAALASSPLEWSSQYPRVLSRDCMHENAQILGTQVRLQLNPTLIVSVQPHPLVRP